MRVCPSGGARGPASAALMLLCWCPLPSRPIVATPPSPVPVAGLCTQVMCSCLLSLALHCQSLLADEEPEERRRHAQSVCPWRVLQAAVGPGLPQGTHILGLDLPHCCSSYLHTLSLLLLPKGPTFAVVA